MNDDIRSIALSWQINNKPFQTFNKRGSDSPEKIVNISNPMVSEFNKQNHIRNFNKFDNK